MKRILLAATFLTAATALSLPAHAIDVNVGAGAEGALDIIIGGGDAGVGAAAGANVGANAGAVVANAAGAAGGAINAGAAAVTAVQLRTSATTNAMANVAATAIINTAVWTNDNVNLGTVVALMTTMNGQVVAIIETTDGWLNNVDRIVVHVSALVQTNDGLVLQTDDNDLKASIRGGLAANAMAGVVGGAAGIDANAAAVTTIELRNAANVMVNVAANTLVNAAVWTNDNVNVGTVQSFMTTVDGQVVAIVDTTDGWLANVDRLAIHMSTMVQTNAGLQVQTNDADLKATATAGLAAQLAAQVAR